MIDQRTLAFINMYGVLGSLAQLCELAPEAGELVRDANISVGFAVKDGPSATLSFRAGRCTLDEGAEHCDIRLPFASPEKFNGLIDGTVTPIPSKGLTKIKFLLGPFTKLTDLLPKYLKATEEALQDPDFFAKSTTLMFHVIVAAIAQIGNEDRVGRASASYMVDGNIEMSIGGGGPKAYLAVRNHRLTAVHEPPTESLSYMEFKDMRLARALFDGKVNSVACVGEGSVRMGGMISQIDNMNRILDRVSMYLA